MLPKLRVTLTALLVTTVLALAASAGLFGSGVSGKHIADVPEVNRALIRQAIVEEPDWQHFQLLAYSRRADELLRLRELSATPARAVVEYAEQAQGETAERAPRPDIPGATGSPAVATAPVAVPPTAAPDGSVTTGAIPSAASPPAPEAVTPPVAIAPEPCPNGFTEVAAVQAGTDATETANVPDQRKPDTKRHHGLKVHKRPRPPRVANTPLRIPPAAQTGFPIDTTTMPAPQPRPNDALINARIESGR